MLIHCFHCSVAFDILCSACPHCQSAHHVQEGIINLRRETENSYFPEDKHDVLFELEDKHFWFRYRNRLILWALKKFKPEAKIFFDAGCGNGIVLDALRNHAINLYAGDYYHTPLMNVKKRMTEVTLFQINLLDLPFVEQFDAIGVFDVIEHIDDDATVISQLYKALHSSGVLLITVPQHPALWSKADDEAHHQRRYTRTELAKKLQHAGFEVLYMNSFIFLLLPLMLLSRMLSKFKTQASDVSAIDSELRLSTWLNKLFDYICRCEEVLLRLNIRLPWGGSLLCVAVKK